MFRLPDMLSHLYEVAGIDEKRVPPLVNGIVSVVELMYKTERQ